MLFFCTYFDHRYLPRGLALLRSLRRHCSSFRLWVLCLDDLCYDALAQLQLAELELVRLSELERALPELLPAKTNRSLIEYYFTCTPALPLHVLQRHPEVDLLIYLDADLFFFGSPTPIVSEIGPASIAIISHRYPSYLRDMEEYGVYNVGMLAFRRDTHGLACLHWWLDRCIEWCYDRLEGDRYADQKYLEQWPKLFGGMVVLEHKGVNVAPWNMMNYQFRLVNGRVFVDDQPLILFHFHGFKQRRPWLFDTHTARYATRPSAVARARVFRPYIEALLEANSEAVIPLGVRQDPRDLAPLSALKRLHRLGHYTKGLLLGQYLAHFSGRVFGLLGVNFALQLADPIICTEWLIWSVVLAQGAALATS